MAKPQVTKPDGSKYAPGEHPCFICLREFDGFAATGTYTIGSRYDSRYDKLVPVRGYICDMHRTSVYERRQRS